MNITFFDSAEKSYLYKEDFNVINKNVSPFKEMIKKEDISSYSISINNEEKISLKETFLFLINIKESGSLYVLFNKSDFNKEEIIKKITELKDIKINNKESSLDKHKKVFDILESYHPIIYLYIEKHEYCLHKDELRKIYKGNSPFFIIEKEIEVEEPIIVTNKEEGKKEKKKFSFKNFILPIKKYKYHFLFLTVSSFLVGFAFSLGLFNSILNKGISVLFYICVLVGAFLQTFIYYDYFKEKKIKDKLFIYSLSFSVLGALFSMGAYSLYHSIDKTEGKENVSFILLLMLSLVVSLIFILISVLIGYLINNKKKKK